MTSGFTGLPPFRQERSATCQLVSYAVSLTETFLEAILYLCLDIPARLRSTPWMLGRFLIGACTLTGCPSPLWYVANGIAS